METPVQSRKVIVAVSEQFQNQRRAQTYLNEFLWSTELCYGFFLDTFKYSSEEKDTPIVNLLSDLKIEAWFLNNKGNRKYNATVDKHIATTQKNIQNLCKAVLVNFHSYFEYYLQQRVDPKKKNWGPFIQSLSDLSLIQGVKPLELQTVLFADVSRIIRNRIIHNPVDELPHSLRGDIALDNKKQELKQRAINSKWCNSYTDTDTLLNEIDRAFDKVITGAIIELDKAKDKQLGFAFFYTLFTFTNYDNLAFQIEEALIPVGVLPSGRIEKWENHVRRTDLIIDEVKHSE